MPNTREKLIELLSDCIDENLDPDDPYVGVDVNYEQIAAHLISNGVTVQGDKDINVPTKWISVKDRLPELHTKVLCCGVKGGRFIAELASWGHENCLYWTKRDGKGCSRPTHWMPLPEAPEGE